MWRTYKNINFESLYIYAIYGFSFCLSFDPDWSSKALIFLSILLLFNFKLNLKTISWTILILLLFTLAYVVLNMVALNGFIYWSLLTPILLCLYFYLVFNQSKATLVNTDYIFYSFIFGVLVSGFASLVNFFVVTESFSLLHLYNTWEYFSVFDIQKIYYAVYVVFSYLFCVKLLMAKKIQLKLFIALGIIFILLLFYTGALSAIIIFFILNALLLIKNYFKESFFKVVFVSVTLTPLLFMLLLMSKSVQEKFIRIDGDPSRIRNYRINKVLVSKAPVFGYGIGSEQKVMMQARDKNKWEYKYNYNAHNQYFEYLIGGGLVYLVLITGLFVILSIYSSSEMKLLVWGFTILFSYIFFIESFMLRHHGYMFFSFLWGLLMKWDTKKLSKNKNNSMTALQILRSKSEQKGIKENKLVTFINLYSYLFFRKNLTLFEHFDEIHIDGIALVYLLSLVGHKIERKSFDMTSLAPKVFNECIKENKNIFFIGSTEKSINEFKEIIKEEYKELKIIGYRNGYFKEKNEEKKALDNIYILNPNIVIVGMGTPNQEKFLFKLKKKGWKGTGYTCGGFIHQTSKGLNYYPNFFNKFNLRWLYRIIDEPKLIKRYFICYPKSLLFFTFDLILYNKKGS
jgi:exopolysaccharide biosynthesis WecB/TagA/CpsF family protein